MSFDWNLKKVGRPATVKKEQEIQEQAWTKEELTVYSDPVVALCKSVVKQWIDDGKPMKDWYGVLPYLNILKQMRVKI